MNYVWHILVVVNIYALLAGSLNLAAGYTGLLSLCHAAFYGIGAYATALLMVEAGIGFFPAMLIAMAITATVSLVIAIPALRLSGDYFVLATLGFQIIVFSILYNWTSLTGGPFGLSGIPFPKVFGLEVDNIVSYFCFSGVLAGLGLLVVWMLVKSPFGRLMRAVRDDQVAAASLGKNVPRVRTAAFAVSAGLAAVPGALFAGYTRYIDPTSFTLLEGIFILSIVVIGGAGQFYGPIVGAGLLVFLPEALRFLQVPDTVAAGLRQIAYGLLLVILMQIRPRGLFGEYEFE